MLTSTPRCTGISKSVLAESVIAGSEMLVTVAVKAAVVCEMMVVGLMYNPTKCVFPAGTVISFLLKSTHSSGIPAVVILKVWSLLPLFVMLNWYALKMPLLMLSPSGT